MNQGQDLDKLVAVKVFGWDRNVFSTQDQLVWHTPEGDWYKDVDVPAYCSNVSDAWGVVKRVPGVWEIKSTPSGEWLVLLTVHGAPYIAGTYEALSSNIAKAICHAALKSVGERV